MSGSYHKINETIALDNDKIMNMLIFILRIFTFKFVA